MCKLRLRPRSDVRHTLRRRMGIQALRPRLLRDLLGAGRLRHRPGRARPRRRQLCVCRRPLRVHGLPTGRVPRRVRVRSRRFARGPECCRARLRERLWVALRLRKRVAATAGIGLRLRRRRLRVERMLEHRGVPGRIRRPYRVRSLKRAFPERRVMTRASSSWALITLVCCLSYLGCGEEAATWVCCVEADRSQCSCRYRQVDVDQCPVGGEPSPGCDGSALEGLRFGCCMDENYPESCYCRTLAPSEGINCGDGPTADGRGNTNSCTSPSGSASSSSSSTGGADVCTSIGFCGPTLDACDCGSVCIHDTPGSYFCGFRCDSDADCAGFRHPVSGNPNEHCTAGICSEA